MYHKCLLTLAVCLCCSLSPLWAQSPDQVPVAPATVAPDTVAPNTPDASVVAPGGTDTAATPDLPVQIQLQVPADTPIRIALDQRVRIKKIGEVVHGKIVEPVYAFDQEVIPAGSIATGR